MAVRAGPGEAGAGGRDLPPEPPQQQVRVVQTMLGGDNLFIVILQAFCKVQRA